MQNKKQQRKMPPTSRAELHDKGWDSLDERISGKSLRASLSLGGKLFKNQTSNEARRIYAPLVDDFISILAYISSRIECADFQFCVHDSGYKVQGMGLTVAV